MNNNSNNRVILGLSGGVDSTVAALLLQEKGYEVIGLYFDVKGDEGDGAVLDQSCGRGRAQLAAEQLGISLLYEDVSDAFERIVIGNFCDEYIRGRTPNPCIICNPNVKFSVLMAAAEREGAAHIATGHYADTYYDEDTGLWHIRRAANERKDQSYMLYRLDQEVISKLILPLNNADDKEEIRELARRRALKNAEAGDSQEICFIEEGDDYKSFLRRRGYAAEEGDFTDSEGKVLGRHSGILNYTIGQRKGLGIALGKPAFVTGIDSCSNRVILGDNSDLFSRRVVSRDNVIACRTDGPQRITAKIRYASKPAEAVMRVRDDGSVLTEFDEPQRAATPGQSIVFYRDDLVIGGGFIEGTE